MLRVLRLRLAHKASSSKPRGGQGDSPDHTWGPARAPAAGTFLILLGLLLLGGCSKSANLPTLAPVKGKVMVDGQAVTSGHVTLIPQNLEKGKEAALSSGEIKSDGSYEIFTGGQAGAPLGPAKLSITPTTVPQQGAKGLPKTEYNPKYRDANKSGLTFTVVENAAPGTYDLKLSK
jgi:hypothetical protein